MQIKTLETVNPCNIHFCRAHFRQHLIETYLEGGMMSTIVLNNNLCQIYQEILKVDIGAE
jgi:hypothetical protein